MTEPTPTGYHTTLIPRGEYGQFSKIEEEMAELQDAHKQGVKILELVEASDLIGAIEGYVLNRYNISLTDLIAMKELTKKAFLEGCRTPVVPKTEKIENKLADAFPPPREGYIVMYGDPLRKIELGDFELGRFDRNNPTHTTWMSIATTRVGLSMQSHNVYAIPLTESTKKYA